jgi:hypothetical protein
VTAPRPGGPQPYPPRPPAPPQPHPQPEPEPLPVPQPQPAKGGARIDQALAALAEVKDAPPAEQVEPLSRAHQVLRETLDSIGDV